MAELLLHISPCPNDTFIFDAWIHQSTVSFATYPLKTKFYDIKTLNELAQQEIPDITKLSVYAAASVIPQYQLLTTGAAIGYRNGPLIIAKKKMSVKELQNATIGIPGKNTTAFALLKIFFPTCNNVKEYFFHEIETALINEEIDAGLIIHETRFTFEKKGLIKLFDLGELWEEAYHLPLPLGVIAVKRNLPQPLKLAINDLTKTSVWYALTQNKISEFVFTMAQINDESVIRAHIQLYVNNFTIELNDLGKKAIQVFFREIQRIKLIEQDIDESIIFI
ncbi:MAG: 1,4-dihydroxy-6-naphthoate synthase [Bacteroidales bacterium]|nr:1,4-dihydroxy-6-naphthoate synthase [Bacteroidales bacterium]